jgi:glycosyltransferase involved in cell wall biosynthesis
MSDFFPFVSICTPTFNRRPFIPYIIRCFQNQTYPMNKIEWIIIDDGTDPIEDLVKHIPQVKYYYYDKKMLLGEKRNRMHEKCSGDIIVYMDDDDYYPPERVQHAVEMLTANPDYLLAGSSEMHIYFDSNRSVYQCGPYKEYHATAATFAFKRQLLNETSYDGNNALAEETKFTKGYTIPMLQLDTLKTIMVFSHKHNSLNKEKLLESPATSKMINSRFKVDDFIKDPILKQFYMYDMNTLLSDYEPGKPENKPEVLVQIDELEQTRKQRIAEHNKMLATHQQIKAAIPEDNAHHLRRNYEKQIADKNIIINELLKKLKELTNELAEYKAGRL